MFKRLIKKITALLAAPPSGNLATGIQKEPELRVVGLFSVIEEEKISEIIHAMLYMNEINKAQKEEKKKKEIKFYLSTYGGSADDMFALYDMMKLIQKDTEISVVGMGKVMSAGVLILAGGTHGKRKIGRNCRVMIHSVIAGNQGSLHNLVNEMEAIKDLQEMYIDRLVEETKMTKIQLKKMLEQKVNVYLSAEKAVEYGIADEII
jgi:ATP-dependent Clp protease protease subunit